MPRPHAVPVTRTVLRVAERTSGSRAIAGVRPPQVGIWPWTAGNGSKRASALRKPPDGGRWSFSDERIFERWMSRRSPRAPGVCSATAPNSHATPSPTAASKIAPPALSRTPSGPTSKPFNRKPTDSSPIARRPPKMIAPSSANNGAYGDFDPSAKSSGAMRAPMIAPATKPASESAPTMSPCMNPQIAITTTKTTMIQSREVMRPPGRYGLFDPLGWVR